MKSIRPGVRGIILAGVHEWDDCALDAFIPRPLLPVLSRPLIEYAIEWLRGAGVGDITVCANSATHAVRRVLGDGRRLRCRLDYYEDWTPRGPAGCLRDAAVFSGGDTFIVIDGSVIPCFNPLPLLEAHRNANALVTVAIREAAQDSAAASPAGCYVFGSRVVDDIPATGYQDIKEVLIPRLHARRERVLAFRAPGTCLRVTGIDSYLESTEAILDHVFRRVQKTRREAINALVHPTARISDDVRLIGPVLIGPDCVLESGVVVVGPAAVGAGCRLRQSAVVSRSILWDGAEIGADAVVEQSVIGWGAEVRARTHTVAQFRPPERLRMLPAFAAPDRSDEAVGLPQAAGTSDTIDASELTASVLLGAAEITVVSAGRHDETAWVDEEDGSEVSEGIHR